MFSPALVCLSVCKITQKTRAWICMKCCVSTDVGTWTNWLIFEPDPDRSLDAVTGFLPPISYRLRNMSNLTYLSANLAYISAISVSICAKLARSILLTDCNTAMEPNFRKKLSTCRILSPKNSYLSFLQSTSSNIAARLDRSITSLRPMTAHSIFSRSCGLNNWETVMTPHFSRQRGTGGIIWE